MTDLFTLPYARWLPYTSFWKRSDADPNPYTLPVVMPMGLPEVSEAVIVPGVPDVPWKGYTSNVRVNCSSNVSPIGLRASSGSVLVLIATASWTTAHRLVKNA